MDIARSTGAFVIVGAMGLVLQTATFWLLRHLSPWSVWLCTAIAVELAIVHNAMWHRRWTWRHRRTGPWWRSCARFHVTNGTLSLGATPLLTWWLSMLGIHVMLAHLVAVAVVGVANFCSADGWAFSDQRGSGLGAAGGTGV